MPPFPVPVPDALPVPVQPPSGNAILECLGLSKRYGSFWALFGARFSIRRGEVLGLIGPNGSGKTTLLECLAGLIPATAGRVVAPQGEIAPSRRKHVLSYIPDGVRPWPDQDVGWVLAFICGLYGTSAVRRIEVIEVLALEHLLGARTGELSKGENKRVLLAMGLLTPQPLLMVDEPFDGLDLRQTRHVMGVLRNHVATGRTLLLSIHQLADAGHVCDRLVMLSGGRVVGEGRLAELSAQAGVGENAGVEEVFLALT